MAIYWGDLHGHSNLSDGRHSPEDYFTFARDRAGLHFCSLTDHADNVPSSRLGFMPDEMWARVKEVTQAFNEPGRFVTLLGLERSVPSWDGRTPGSMLVHYRGTGPLVRPMRPVRDWLRPRAVDYEAEMRQLWAALQGVACLRTIVHPASTRQGYSWTQAPAAYEIDLLEVYSKRGCSEVAATPFPIIDGAVSGTRPGGTAHDALAAGFKTGFVAGSGTHFGMPGSNIWENDWGNAARYDKSGLTAVMADELTREAVFDALKQRRCYATTWERIELVFTINESPMGSVVTAPDKLRIHVRCKGTRDIKRAEVFKDGAILRHKTGGRDELEAYFDETVPDKPAWFYVRITQTGEDYAWSSPIWVTPQTK